MADHVDVSAAILFCSVLALGTIGASCTGGGSNDGESGEACTPGESESCTCSDGAAGTRVCQSQGTFGSCRCGAASDAGFDVADTSSETNDSGTADTDDSDRDADGGIDEGRGGTITNRLWSLYTSEKGVETVEPGAGTLEPAVEAMKGSSGTRPFTQDMIRLEPGGTYRVDNPIRLREGQDVQAEGATIIPMNDDSPVFVFDTDALVWGGTIDLEDSGATAFEPSAVYPSYQPFGTAWTRPAGPLGTYVTAEPGTGAVGLDISFDERYPHGFTTPILTTDGVDNVLQIGPIGGKHGWTNSNEYFLRAKDYRTLAHLTGSQGISRSTRNRIVYDLFGGSNVDHAVHINGSGVLLNVFEGKIRSLESHDPAINFAETADDWPNGQNIVMDYDGRSEEDFGDQWRDDSGASGNGIYAYGGVSFPERGPGVDTRDVVVAEGADGELTASELQSTLDAAAESSSDVRIEAGTEVVSDGRDDLVVPEGVAVGARGALIEIDGTIRFEPGGLLLGGQVHKKTEGPALVVRADGETIDRPTGPVMTFTMGFAHDDYPGPDQSCDPALRLEAVNGGEITGLVNSYYAYMCEQGVDIRADAESGIEDNRLFLAINWGGYLLRMRGDGDIASNTIKGLLQPRSPANTDDGTEYPTDIAGWIIHGPNVRDNRIDGRIWDAPGIQDEDGQRPMIWIRETGGGNMYSPYDTQSQDYRSKHNSLRGDDSQFTQWGYTDMFEDGPDSFVQKTKSDRLFADEFMPAYWKPLSTNTNGED